MSVKTVTVGPLQANCFILSSPGGKAVVIDPGGDPARIISELERNGLVLTAIINTHGHFDHASGNRRLKEMTGAPILVHRKDAQALENIQNQARFFMLNAENSPPADKILEEGDAIDLDGQALTVLHTPGHTVGGISIAGPGFVFSGDTLFAGSIGRTDLPGGSYSQIIDSIRAKLLTLPDETIVYPGHGPATTVGIEKTTNPFLI